MQSRYTVATLVAFVLGVFAMPVRAEKFVSGTALVIVGSTTITEPGVYIVGKDFAGTVDIDANNVTLDLNNKKISDGAVSVLVVAGHTDVIIKNGILENATQNHILATSCTNLIIQNIDFIGSQTVISLDDCESALINNCTMREVTSHGVLLVSSTGITIDGCAIFNSTLQVGVQCSLCNNCNFNNVSINDNQVSETTSAEAMFINLSDNVTVRQCRVHNNTKSSATLYLGFDATSSRNVSFFDCSFNQNVVSAGTLAGFFNMACENVAYDQCTTQTNVAFSLNVGFNSSSAKSVMHRNCTHIGNFGSTNHVGFNADATSSDVLLFDCVVSKNIADSSFAGVSFADSVACVLSNCLVESNTAFTLNAIGFDLATTHTTLVIDCVAQKNFGGADGIGFRLTECTECTVRNNIAVANQTSMAGNSRGFVVDDTLIGFLNNTLFSNQAQDHGAGANNFDISPFGAIPFVTFNQMAGTFSATPTPYDNISVIPS